MIIISRHTYFSLKELVSTMLFIKVIIGLIIAIISIHKFACYITLIGLSNLLDARLGLLPKTDRHYKVMSTKEIMKKLITGIIFCYCSVIILDT